jgi:hypothetical protein
MSFVAATKPPARRKCDPLTAPRREVIYIFEREGSCGGPYWLLVLACGHAVSRRRHNSRNFVQTLFRPLSEKLAPRYVQCHYCGMCAEQRDPWILIQALEQQK